MIKHQTLPQACLVAACGLFAALTAGCTQPPLCEELGDCGGTVPLGTWQLGAGHPSCSEDLYTPPIDTRLVGGEVPSARNAVIEPAFFDWCLLLVTNDGKNIQAKPPRFVYESAQIGWASLTYNADNTYTLGMSRTGTFSLDFPAVCMREFGAMDNRTAFDPQGMPVGDPTNICKQLELPLRASGIGEGSYANTTCNPNPADPAGCLCFFDVTETAGGGGHYEVMKDRKTILHLPSSTFPQKATFCHKGDTLELTGADGAYLFGQRPLRTMSLGKAVDPCTNGKIDPGETAIDCGGTCMACPAPAAM